MDFTETMIKCFKGVLHSVTRSMLHFSIVNLYTVSSMGSTHEAQIFYPPTHERVCERPLPCAWNWLQSLVYLVATLVAQPVALRTSQSRWQKMPIKTTKDKGVRDNSSQVRRSQHENSSLKEDNENTTPYCPLQVRWSITNQSQCDVLNMFERQDKKNEAPKHDQISHT